MSTKTITVHSETFHADDATAVYLLQHTAEFSGATVVRTRDAALIDASDVVADVGCVYDHSRRRYDHHQSEFDVRFPGSDVPCASAGLVYIHYGREVVARVAASLGLSLGGELEFVYRALYFHLLQEIDAVDNGVARVAGAAKKAYSVSSDITSRVALLNPLWNDPAPDADALFARAVALVGREFERLLAYVARCWVPGFPAFRDAFARLRARDATGRVLLLGRGRYEDFYVRQVAGAEELLYVVRQNERGCFAVRAVPYPNQPFRLRKPLPYAGEAPEVIAEKTGIDGVVFSHKKGFLAVLRTVEAAMRFAEFAVAFGEEKE